MTKPYGVIRTNSRVTTHPELFKEIRIVVAAPRTRAVVKMVPDTLEALQAEVAGDLEALPTTGPAIGRDPLLHQRKRRQPRARPEAESPQRYQHFIVGNIVASKATGTGNEIGLTEREADFARRSLDNLRGFR
jgi:hypothetical protein